MAKKKYRFWKVNVEAATLEMVNGFGLAAPPGSINPPSLTSNHISGKAIDMTIKWTGTIKAKKNTEVVCQSRTLLT